MWGSERILPEVVGVAQAACFRVCHALGVKLTALPVHT